jgi:hypothetical protein
LAAAAGDHLEGLVIVGVTKGLPWRADRAVVA